MSFDQSIVSTTGSTLLSTLSISFLIATFMLSEYLKRSNSDYTPRERRPFRYGSITMIIVVWLGAIGLVTLAVATIGPSWAVGGSVLMIALQIFLIVTVITWLGYQVLFE